VNCISCHQAPEECECLQELAGGTTPATVVEGTIGTDPDRRSAVWVREDPRYGPPYLTVVLEPGAKATVDDVRLAVGALIRWRIAVSTRVQRPFTEDAALAAILRIHVQLAGNLGEGARGIHVALAREINTRLVELLRDHANDCAIQEEAQTISSKEPDREESLEDAIKKVVISRFEAGHSEVARFNSFLGGAVAESYLRAIGYSPDASRQIRERATEDILLGREPFAPEYPADPRRARECVRKARRRATRPGADHG
jgi:hypothetical protein